MLPSFCFGKLYRSWILDIRRSSKPSAVCAYRLAFRLAPRARGALMAPGHCVFTASQNHSLKRARYRHRWRQAIQNHLIAAVQNVKRSSEMARNRRIPRVWGNLWCFTDLLAESNNVYDASLRKPITRQHSACMIVGFSKCHSGNSPFDGHYPLQAEAINGLYSGRSFWISSFSCPTSLLAPLS